MACERVSREFYGGLYAEGYGGSVVGREGGGSFVGEGVGGDGWTAMGGRWWSERGCRCKEGVARDEEACCRGEGGGVGRGEERKGKGSPMRGWSRRSFPLVRTLTMLRTPRREMRWRKWLGWVAPPAEAFIPVYPSWLKEGREKTLEGRGLGEFHRRKPPTIWKRGRDTAGRAGKITPDFR